MATYNKHNDFTEQLCTGKHDFTAAGHVFKAMLTLTAPTAANSIKSDLTEIAGGNGYTAGGSDIQNTLAETTGTATVSATNVTWTATGGSIAAFRYVDIYNDTQTSPVDPLVCWWDYGASLTLAVGESFTIKFDNQPASGAVFDLA